MKFLCLGYFDVEAMNALPKAEIDALMGECWPHVQTLYRTGRVVVEAGLAEGTRRLRRVKGKVAAIDGPYTETKEVLGSAFLIEADDMEDATRIASLHPTTQVSAGEGLGWVLEIRPVHYFEMPVPKS